MIVVVICLIGLYVLYQNRDQAGCLMLVVFTLLFLFLAAGSMTPLDTLQDAERTVHQWNLEMDRQSYDRRFPHGRP